MFLPLDEVALYFFPHQAQVIDLCPVDVQKVFNAMSSAKETKIKVKNILNMVF